VLYVNHTARVSGGERSLLELLAALPHHVEPILACPDGDLSRRANAMGVRTVRIDPLQVGFGSGPGELLRAPGTFVRAAARVARLSQRLRVDAIHATSARAGIAAAGAALIGAPRPVVDVRDALPPGPMAAAVRWALRASSRALVFNSQYTRREFGPTRPAETVVVYPPVDVERFTGAEVSNRRTPNGPLTMGVIGQITPWKAQDDAIRILARLRTRFPSLRLRIVGSVVFAGPGVTLDNEAFGTTLVALAQELGVADAVEFAGAIEDVDSVFASLDVVLVPSWQEPFGRVVAEAMAAGVPVVATSRGGPAELIEDGASGYLAEPRNPDAWLEPVSGLLADTKLRARICLEGRRRVVAALDRQETLDRIVRLYTTRTSRSSRRLVASTRRGAAS
jgi:glycosyltransferase involved in cell wall biosynthesis